MKAINYEKLRGPPLIRWLMFGDKTKISDSKNGSIIINLE